VEDSCLAKWVAYQWEDLHHPCGSRPEPRCSLFEVGHKVPLTAVLLPAVRPRAVHPTAARPTAARPTAARPTAARPTVARPTAARPTAVPPAAYPTEVPLLPVVARTIAPTTALPTAALPTAALPTAVRTAVPGPSASSMLPLALTFHVSSSFWLSDLTVVALTVFGSRLSEWQAPSALCCACRPKQTRASVLITRGPRCPTRGPRCPTRGPRCPPHKGRQPASCQSVA
jgi:hypothetical protein